MSQLGPTGLAPQTCSDRPGPRQLQRAFQHRKYLGPMDGYKPHRILIWNGFLCQRNKASSSSHRCRVCSPRIKLFSPTLPSTHFALNPPSRIYAPRRTVNPHSTHTRPLSRAHAGPARTTRTSPGPLGPAYLSRPPSIIHQFLGPIPFGPPRHHGDPPPPGTRAPATGTRALAPASGAPQAPHLRPPASRCDPLPRGHGIWTTGPKPTALGPRPDPRSQ